MIRKVNGIKIKYYQYYVAVTIKQLAMWKKQNFWQTHL